MKTGKVYLTGGGCGDVKLLTLKALEVLRSCDAVVYDSLVSEELLEWTKADCEKIYVGKRYGGHAVRQSEINVLLVEKAQEGKCVVRLKGGDPYVFGRGGEEFLALREAGIYCEEIPGISSAIAAPAAAGIPVTHRGLSAGITVVTGTAAEENEDAGPKLDFELLARLDGTLVILMGMHHLKEIVEKLIQAGKHPDTPCAIIMEGTTERQRCLRTVLSELFEEARTQGFAAPAVIVIGAVAGLELLSEKEESLMEESGFGNVNEEKESDGENEKSGRSDIGNTGRPLTGTTAGVTGTPHFADKLAGALREQGAAVWDLSFMEIRPSENGLPDLENFGWLVFTSPNGVSVFLDKMKREQRDLRTLFGKRIAVIGPGTAAILEEAGMFADYMPEVYDAAHLAQGLAERMTEEQQGRKVQSAVFLRAETGSDRLPYIFTEKGIPFLDWPLYELGVCEEKRAESITKRPDYIIFGSALGVRAYFEGLDQAGQTNRESKYVCIGEMCGEELKKHTESDFLTAREASIDSIVECLSKEKSLLFTADMPRGVFCEWSKAEVTENPKNQEEDHVPIQKIKER